ncbi:MAG: DNA polymerase III subunit alpha [Chthonomonas sp.]|nr:DNA polymerase III subunit alpha [Chthonomonas sp.]
MAGVGSKVAHWRETREWWLGEPTREFAITIDAKGHRAISERTIETIETNSKQNPLDERHNEDLILRVRRVRDETVSAATGYVPKGYYEARKQEQEWAEKRSFQHRKSCGYAPLHVLSGYSFGRSTVFAGEIAAMALEAGCLAACLSDTHSLMGVVEHVKACHRLHIKPLVGASIELPEGGEIVLIAKNKAGYKNLSMLVTECHLAEPRCFPLGSWDRIAKYSDGLICLTGGDTGPLDRALIAGRNDEAFTLISRLKRIFGREHLLIEIERSYLPWTLSVTKSLLELANAIGLKAVAGGSITHSRREDFPALDTLICAHSLCTIDEVIGRKQYRDETQPQVSMRPDRAINAERYFRSVQEASVAFSSHPELLDNTLRIADMCDDDVLPGRASLPQLFENDQEALENIVKLNASLVYGSLKKHQQRRLDYEMSRITRLGFSTHFLAAWDYCRWAREQGIHMSGRGSVVDSAVAYVLGFSRIDAMKHRLHFDRFLPEDGSKRPDIDIDFEAHKREDVRRYVIHKYGSDRVAAVCAIGTFMTRGIIREVGKVMGLPPESISFLAKKLHGGVAPDQLESALEKRPELRDSNISKERFRWVIQLASSLMDLPRNVRTHSSGVIISNRPICETVPVMWSASEGEGEHLRMIQWDKRSAKHFFDKFDILCLRGQDVICGVEERVRISDPDFSAERIAASDDPDVYRAMRSGELIGIPQSASPAMRQAHVRLRTDNLHDASLVQAGIRPGVGGAVKLNELIARRRGKEYNFSHPKLEDILGCTYGIIVFQEQVDQLLQAFAGMTSGEAEELREDIHKKRREDFGAQLKSKLIDRIIANGHGLSIAEEVFEYVSGFKGYGFAQGHALAFAEVSLRSVYLMQHHPAAYFASLLSAQPAGYYPSATIANEARIRGVPILSLDVSRSKERFDVEDVQNEFGLVVPLGGIRTGLMQLSGLSSSVKTRILEHQHSLKSPAQFQPALPNGRIATLEHATPPLEPFGGFFDFVAKVEPNRDDLEALILSGALDRFCPNRRAMLWAIPAAQEYMRLVQPRPGELSFDYPTPPLPREVADFSIAERRIWERALLGMDTKDHLMSFERDRVRQKGAITTESAKRLKDREHAIVVGNPLRLRFPPTQSGKRVVFFDLEDETGLLNVTCFDAVYIRYGHAIVTSPYVTVRGEFQNRDGYPAFLATSVFSYDPVIRSANTRLPQVVGDFLVS